MPIWTKCQVGQHGLNGRIVLSLVSSVTKNFIHYVNFSYLMRYIFSFFCHLLNRQIGYVEQKHAVASAKAEAETALGIFLNNGYLQSLKMTHLTQLTVENTVVIMVLKISP